MVLIKNTYNQKLIILLCVFYLFTTCSQDDENIKNDDDTIKQATINFFNESSFKVDIYKNLNPEHFDPTALVCTVNPGSTQKVTMYPSADKVVGDVFYPRYKVLLANSLETATTNIYVDAQRDMSNISFVVEEGKTYTKQIPQPTAGQLKFINGYIKVQNTGSTQIQIQRANGVLLKLDDNGAYLNTGSILGYYEITLNQLDTVLNMSQLKAFSSSHVDFPVFDIERGKLYSFIVNNSVITGPVVTNLDPLRK